MDRPDIPLDHGRFPPSKRTFVLDLCLEMVPRGTQVCFMLAGSPYGDPLFGNEEPNSLGIGMCPTMRQTTPVRVFIVMTSLSKGSRALLLLYLYFCIVSVHNKLLLNISLVFYCLTSAQSCNHPRSNI